MTRYTQVNHIRILVTFVHRINKQEEYCLSLARTLTSRYESRIDDRMQIERTSNMVIYTGRSCSELSYCPVMKDQQDCVLNLPEELGKKQLFLKHQYSTGIFFYFLLLLPNMLSTDRQTNEEIVGIDSEDFPSFSRNELLHLLLDALVVNDEEDLLHSSIRHNRRKNISLVQCQSNSFSQWELFMEKSRQVLFFVVLLWPLIGMQNLLHSGLTHILRADRLEFMFHCSNSSQTYLIHEKY